MSASLLEQIAFVEYEADRLETWLACAESDEMEDHLRRRLHIAREAVRTLDAVLLHRDEFAQIVRRKHK